MGSESSDDPGGSKKTFGDVYVARYVNPDGSSGNTLNDGKRYAGSTIVARAVASGPFASRLNDAPKSDERHRPAGPHPT